MPTALLYHLQAATFARLPHGGTRDSLISDLLITRFDQAAGVAFGEVHGVYAAPDFAGQFALKAAPKGAGLFFCEMLPASLQPALDRWQYHDDGDRLFHYFNSRTRVFAARQFEFYARMFHQAREAGMRIVALDTDDDYHRACSREGLKARNDHWTARITEECRNGPRRGEKFLLYAGQGHVIPGYDRQESVARRLNIPALLVETGTGHGLVRLSRRHDLSVIVLPHHAEQDPRMNAPVLRAYGDIRPSAYGVSRAL